MRFLLILAVLVCFTGCNPWVQANRVINKTIDADNVIYNYEWFKLRHEDIGAIDQKILDTQNQFDNFKAYDPEKGLTREESVTRSNLSTVVLGLKQQRSDLAAEYNAKSRMVNRSIFKAGDTELPERIAL
jgi:hypothetical protein